MCGLVVQVPMDQPQAALAMLNTFIEHKPFY